MSTALLCPSSVVRVYAHPSAFQDLEEGWRSLFRQHGDWNLFLSWQWFYHWWAHFGAGKELQLLTLSHRDSLVGIVPMMVEPDQAGRPRLALIGSDRTTDYGDLLVDPRFRDALMEALAGFVLQGFDRWELAELHSLPEESPLLGPFRERARALGMATELRVGNVCPAVRLMPTWEEYLATLSKKDRHELRRKIRRAQGVGEQELHFLSRPQEVADHLEAFFCLHRSSNPEKAGFLDQGMLSFFRDLALAFAEEGWLRLNLMRIDGREVAASLSFSRGDRVLLYNSGLDPDYRSHSVGIALHAAEIQQAIQERKLLYDFLRGNEPYKYGFGAQDRAIYTLTLRPADSGAADGEGGAEQPCCV